jgi:hypothetical protein
MKTNQWLVVSRGDEASGLDKRFASSIRFERLEERHQVVELTSL